MDEAIANGEWLEIAGTQGWVVFMKDTRIRYNLAERSGPRRDDGRARDVSRGRQNRFMPDSDRN